MESPQEIEVRLDAADGIMWSMFSDGGHAVNVAAVCFPPAHQTKTP
jgi:hypothetical protein